jgi:hypothetical protein
MSSFIIPLLMFCCEMMGCAASSHNKIVADMVRTPESRGDDEICIRLGDEAEPSHNHHAVIRLLASG